MTTKTLAMTAAVLGALLIFSGSGAAAASGTKYYPDDYGTLVDPAFTTYPMPASTKSIDDLSTQWWYDVDGSTVDQTFDDTPFDYHLALSDYVTGSFAVGVVLIAPDLMSYSNVAWVSVTGLGPGVTLYEGAIPMPALWTIPQDWHLGFMIDNTPDAAQPVSGTPAQKAAAKAYNAHRAVKLDVATDNEFEEPPTWFVTGAPYSPTVPLPELSTIALMGAGVGIVGAVAVVRNRKN